MKKKRFLTMLVLLMTAATGAWAQDPATYKVTMKEGTVDAENWTISPAEAKTDGVAEGTAVTATYSGKKRVKSVLATGLTPPPPPEATPLTIEAITAGTIMVYYPQSGMKYSKDGGTTKTTLSASTSITVAAGDKVEFYGNGTSITSYNNSNNKTKIQGSGNGFTSKVYGNIMSLVDETGYETATTLTGNSNFKELFNGYDKLTDASGLLLPATTLTQHCYNSMFIGCTSLKAGPAKLPSESLTASCYMSMFSGCTALTEAPELPATTLANYCYSNMFKNCTSLKTAPTLPATTLVNYCYQAMFEGCSNLVSVTCLATSISASNCLTNWLKDAGNGMWATNPKLYVDPSMTTATWNNGNFTVTAVTE